MKHIVGVLFPIMYIMIGSAGTIMFLNRVVPYVATESKEINNAVTETAEPQINKENEIKTDSYEKSAFSFSPDQKHIMYIQNVFTEYGEDHDRHWSLQIVDVAEPREDRIFVGDYKIATAQWLNDTTVRVYRNAGTGVRGYHDLSISRSAPLILKDYLASNPNASFWQNDREYEEMARNYVTAEAAYRELTAGDSAF